jgi:MFS family permease
MAHLAGEYATVVMVAGALITGFTVLSAFTATRVYLSEQFPTALRGRGQPFGESFGRLFAGVLAPFLMVPHTSSPTIFFGTILVVVAIGAFIPLAFGRETLGQLETVTEGAPAMALRAGASPSRAAEGRILENGRLNLTRFARSPSFWRSCPSSPARPMAEDARGRVKTFLRAVGAQD